MDLEIIKPSFVRNGSLDGYSDATDDHLTEENKYNLTGFYIGSRFAEVVNDPNEYGEQWVLDTSTGSTSDISNFADQIRSDLKDKWEEVSREEFEGYMTKVENVNFGQYVRESGLAITDTNYYGIDRMPFLTYEYDTLKSAHNAMMSNHNKMRLYFFIIQAKLALMESATKRLDETFIGGSSSIESEMQLYERRSAKQLERHNQLVGATKTLIDVNNAYYKQKIQSIKDSDTIIRVFKAASLYGSLTSAVVYLASFPFAAAPTPEAFSIKKTLQTISLGLSILAGVSNIGEKIQRIIHEYEIPQKMETDLMKFSSDYDDDGNKAVFKDLINYKEPINPADNYVDWVSALSIAYSGLAVCLQLQWRSLNKLRKYYRSIRNIQCNKCNDLRVRRINVKRSMENTTGCN